MQQPNASHLVNTRRRDLVAIVQGLAHHWHALELGGCGGGLALKLGGCGVGFDVQRECEDECWWQTFEAKRLGAQAAALYLMPSVRHTQYRANGAQTISLAAAG